MKCKSFLMAMLLIALVMTSCQEEPSLSFVEGDKLEVVYGDTIPLTLKYTPEDAYLNNVTWKCSDLRIVTRLSGITHETGQGAYYYARGIGEVTISAEGAIDGEPVMATCQITVNEVQMTSLQIDSAVYALKPGDKVKLTATYEPSNTSFPQLSWKSSDNNIASVNSKGELSAKNVGECTLTVSDARSGLESQCQIVVSPIEMTSLQLNKSNCEIELGKHTKLYASFEPKNVTYPELYWHSSDESVATVSSDGVVDAIGVGECVISVTNSDNSMEAKCDITVFLIEMTAISCESEKTMEQYESFHLKATPQPTDATITNNALRWHSSDESIATVDELTGEVSCVGLGECTITISNIYNSVTTSCHLTVLPVTVKELSLNKIDLYLPKGESEQLYCTVSPENAHNKNVIWESSNKSVAKVSEDGTVTAVGVGKATIKAIPQDGSDCSAECSVCVGTEDLITHVELYIAKYISITSKLSDSGPFFYINITNKGTERIYLQKAVDRFSDRTVYDEGAYIEAGESLKFTSGSPMLTLFFVMYGHECPVPV